MSIADDLDELFSGRALVGLVVDFVCADCGRRRTRPATWEVRPVCCEREMVDLPGTLRARPDAAA
jgi:hypothetical protein